MKKLLSAAILALVACIGLKAQVVIINDNLWQERMSEIKVTVLDAQTGDPMPFASVYVVPSKDTTITNFTLSDVNGVAKLDEVPYGSYVFHVEMMGYKPFLKERHFKESKVDMGTVKLEEDPYFLEGVVVTAAGNPIVVKKDTVEFNASAFRVGANAMLKDLLLRMPGMEITDDGKVKFNGEEIDKITVGGRTFFFGDQSTALNNLPAAVVDKIRVIDRESEDTRATGIQDGSRETVLDVALKKEYEKGWFGNVALKGGTTVGVDDDTLRDNRGLLFSGNVLISAYTEKDQLTVIGNLLNVDDNDMPLEYIDEDGNVAMINPGLSTAAQLGVNVNTTRIKDVETTVSANYKYSDTDSGTRTNRTTYQDDGDIITGMDERGKAYANSVSANMEFQKEQGKVWFHIRPEFRYNDSNSYSFSSSQTFREGSLVNGSENSVHRLSSSNYAYLEADFTFRELWGRNNRNLGVGLSTYYNTEGGESSESSVFTLGGVEERRSMSYISDKASTWLNGSLNYSEPLSDKWTLATTADITWTRKNLVRDAFDAGGANDYYSSVSRGNSLAQEYDLTLQYKWGEDSWLTAGASLSGLLNEVYSKSFGIEEISGTNEWNWFITPTFRIQHSKDNDRIRLYVYGYAQAPPSSRMLPVLDISNPARLSMGNVYLKPYSTTFFNLYWTRNNREKFTNLMVYWFGNIFFNPISSAQWYDASGILYSIPVNTAKPKLSTTFSASYTAPLDSQKNLSLSLYGQCTYISSVSYQAATSLAGLDKDTFNYSAFMDGFWGDASGNTFYSGASGFSESNTTHWSPYASLTLKFNQDNYSLAAEVNSTGHIARYSLDPRANLNTLDTELLFRGSYTTKHEFEFNTDISYAFFKGYAEGYGLPEWRWNAEINKSIGAFNLSLTVHDILNQTRNLRHTITANYEEDTYRLVMGRYFLFGVKWNFGKMNAAHSSRAQSAAWDMLF